jgi:3',5'-cyclic AMP phosphodiesterase CpdA
MKITGSEPLRFAVRTDTHVSPARAAAVEQLGWASVALARLGPDLVLHCGDITDTGLPREYDLYQQAIPAALRGRVRHVPGHHDVRWDLTAKGIYQAHFGAAPYSFDASGVHFIGFDPTQALLEAGLSRTARPATGPRRPGPPAAGRCPGAGTTARSAEMIFKYR